MRVANYRFVFGWLLPDTIGITEVCGLGLAPHTHPSRPACPVSSPRFG